MEKHTLGSFIAVLRKSKGMTQKELGELLGVSDKAVSRWERDECAPDIFLIPVIADIFGVTADELLRGEKSNSEPAPLSNKKSEAVYKHIIYSSVAKFKRNSTVSVGITLIGLIVAAIFNYALFRCYLAFGAAMIFAVVSAVCEIIFLQTALTSLGGEESDLVQDAKNKIKRIAFLVFALIFSAALSCVPLLFSGNAYSGILLVTWLVYGLCGFALGALISLVIYNIIRMKLMPENAKPYDKAKAKLGKKVTVIAVCAVLVTAGAQIALNAAGYTLYSKGTYYNVQEFVDFMETPMSYYGDASEPVTANENEPTTQAVLPDYENGDEDEQYIIDTVEDENGNVICSYAVKNESVIQYSVEKNSDGEYGFRVYTRYDADKASDAKTKINICCVFVYISQIAAAAAVYFIKAKKIGDKYSC